MIRFAIIVFLAAMSSPALAEGGDTYIGWSGWTVHSTENLWLGCKHTSFPLTYLFDGKPSTAWVFSGKGKDEDGKPSGYALTLTRDDDRKPVTADSVWIMNGYNKSSELFQRNNRITEMRLYVNGDFVKKIALADSMGWHKVTFPRKAVWELKLDFVGFQKGTDDDICVSELALYDKGRKIDLKMPNVIEFAEGDVSDAPCLFYSLIDRNGKELAAYEAQNAALWSPSRRHVAGFENSTLWVVDTHSAKRIMSRAVPLPSGYEWMYVSDWSGDTAVEVTFEKHPKLKNGQYSETPVYLTKTIRLPRR